jgi:short subunit dehydrogenase-like uncharacterized protein
MSSTFLLYGSTGTVGEAIARFAVQRGLRPILAGRNARRLQTLAAELGLEDRVFGLDDTVALERFLADVPVVLNCAGPFIYTYRPLVDACLRAGTHYLDITGEIPVYEALAALDQRAKATGIMLLPGVGFDVAATDCLAAHLKRRLPSATHLALAIMSEGPATLPPGTLNTAVEMIPYRHNVRRYGGQLEPIPPRDRVRLIDFGHGPVEATMLGWGDVFMAFYSTGIPNIEDYMVIPPHMRKGLILFDALWPVFRLPAVRTLIKRLLQAQANTTFEQRARTRTTVWGEARDGQGQTVVSRLYGPETGVIWTAHAALGAVQHAIAGDVQPGFQTASLAYGADFVLECEGITREDLG